MAQDLSRSPRQPATPPPQWRDQRRRQQGDRGSRGVSQPQWAWANADTAEPKIWCEGFLECGRRCGNFLFQRCIITGLEECSVCSKRWAESSEGATARDMDLSGGKGGGTNCSSSPPAGPYVNAGHPQVSSHNAHLPSVVGRLAFERIAPI